MTDPGWPQAGPGPTPGGGPTAMAGWGAAPAGQPGASPQSETTDEMRRVTRPLDGLLVGIAAAAIGGFLWWAAVALTQRQFVYGAIIVGLIVGQGVLIGARKGGPIPALIAFFSTLISLTIAEYFIQRSLAISELGADLDLWLGWSMAQEMIETTISDDPVTLLFWFLAAAVAGFVAGTARDPII